jgi:hypothetical protein
VSTAQIENLNLLATEVQRDPVPESLIGKPRFLLLWRCFVPLHLSNEIGSIEFMSDLPYVRVCDVSLGKWIMIGRRDQETNWLANDVGNRVSFSPRYGFRIQGIEYDHAVAGRDDSAIQIAGTEHVMSGNDLAYVAGLAALRLLGVRRSARQEHDNQSYG